MSKVFTKHDWLWLLSMAAIFVSVQFCLRWFTGFDDGLRHISFAVQWLQEGYVSVADFPTLPFTVLHTLGVDPWFGYHALLLMFAPLGTFWGLKVVTVVSCVVFAGIVLFVYKKMALVMPRLFAAITILGSSSLLYRIQLGRPLTLTLPLTLCAMYALFTRRYVMLSIAVIVHVLLHQTFILLIGLLGLFTIIRGIHEKKFTYVIQDGAVIFGSLLGGLLLHPDPVGYMSVSWLTLSIIGAPSEIFSVGTEVLPTSLYSWIQGYVMVVPVFFALWVMCVKKKAYELMPWFGVTLLMVVGMFVSNRFNDYAWIFAIATIGLSYSRLEIHQSVKKVFNGFGYNRPYWIGALLAALFVIFGTNVIETIKTSRMTFTAMDAWHQGLSSVEISQNSQIFNGEWDRYTVLNYFRPDIKAVTGADPYLLYAASPAYYFMWWHVNQGDALICATQICTTGVTPFEAMQSTFGATYLIYEPYRQKKLDEQILKDPRFVEMYRMSEFAAYKLK